MRCRIWFIPLFQGCIFPFCFWKKKKKRAISFTKKFNHMSKKIEQLVSLKSSFILKEYSQFVRPAIISRPKEGYDFLLTIFELCEASKRVVLAARFWSTGAACDHCDRLGGYMSQSNFGEKGRTSDQGCGLHLFVTFSGWINKAGSSPIHESSEEYLDRLKKKKQS